MNLLKKLGYIFFVFIIAGLQSKLFAVPITFNYQGHLATSQGIPLNDVSVNLTFKLYESSTSNKALWCEMHNGVIVSKGIINILLGEITPLTSTVLSKAQLFLGLSVNDDPEMQPRQQLSSVIFSIRAAEAESVVDNAITTEKIADGAITASKIKKGAIQILDPDGNFQVEGMTNIRELPPNFSPDPKKKYDQIFAKAGGIDFSSDSTLINGIVLYWKLDKTDDSQIIDSVELDHGIPVNHPLVVDGQLGFGYARFLDASKKQYLKKQFDTKLNFGSSSFSISFWMKAKAPNDWSVIISKANNWGTAIDDYGWLFANSDEASTTLEFRINPCGTKERGHKIVRAENVFDNHWHHVVGIRNNTNIALYIDGQLAGTQSEITQSVDIDAPFEIGALSSGYYYSGYIDDIAVWNRTLTDNEIKELYNDPKAIPTFDGGVYYMRSDGVEVSLQGKWKMNENDILYNEGNVHVKGGIKIGNASDCVPVFEGMMRYNSKSKIMEFCNGTEWRPTFAPINDGQSPDRAGKTCKTLLDKGHSKGDGVYWINPDGYGSEGAFQVFCDMSTDGGGWTRIDYANDLELKNHFSGGDAWRWLPDNFQTVLSEKQIKEVQSQSTEGKQRYVGKCVNVLHYNRHSDNSKGYAFGYKFLNGDITKNGAENLGVDFEIIKENCQQNDATERETWIDFFDVRVPIINVYSNDSGNAQEKFGSALTENPAWLR